MTGTPASLLESRGRLTLVEHSATGRAWVMAARDEKQVADLARLIGGDDLLATLMSARGIQGDNAGTFLKPTLRAAMPDPYSLRDMDSAVTAFIEALDAGQSITVFADYDVDGATSAAQIVRYGRALGKDIDVYVPDRLKEGYGPSRKAFETLKARGSDLVITVDCGAVAHDALEAAQSLGLQIVVLDHHLASGRLPPARAIVNPNRSDCNSGLGYLAAAGVAFLFLVALQSRLRDLGRLPDPAPDLLSLIGLTALGTYCDVCPLDGLNRALVAQGLKMLNAAPQPGIRALIDVAGWEGPVTTQALGFVLGPRINAGGRVGEAGLGALLLTTDNAAEAAEAAARLDSYNSDRRAVESMVLDDAMLQAEAMSDDEVLVVAGEGWHPGVVGIVAGRLKERFQKPAIAIGIDPAGGPCRGSGRSVAGFNLGAAITSAREAGILLAGGGHAMAAGLTIVPEQLAYLRAFLAREAVRFGGVAAEPLIIDAQVSIAGLTLDLVDRLQPLGPFGAGNPVPVLAVMHTRLGPVVSVGDTHLRVTLEGEGGARCQAMAFRARDTELGRLALQQGAAVHAAVTIERGKGRFLDIQLQDLAPVS